SVGFDPAVAKKGPMCSGSLHAVQVAGDDKDFLPIVGGYLQKGSGGIANKTCSPEFEAARRRGALVSHTVHGYDIDSVGDGMASLDNFPGGVLGDAVFRLFAGVPSNGRRIEKHFCSAQGGEPGSLGIPLVPADEDPDSGVARFPGVKTQVSRSEIELFMIER